MKRYRIAPHVPVRKPDGTYTPPLLELGVLAWRGDVINDAWYLLLMAVAHDGPSPFTPQELAATWTETHHAFTASNAEAALSELEAMGYVVVDYLN